VIKVDNSQKPKKDRRRLQGRDDRGSTAGSTSSRRISAAVKLMSSIRTSHRWTCRNTRSAIRSCRKTSPIQYSGHRSNVYVTYAKQDEDAEDDVPGPGLGFVDVFTPEGELISGRSRKLPERPVGRDARACVLR
jgi:hypothetical protein